MSGHYKDITGQKFGRLTTLYRLHNYHKQGTYWLCICDCGNFKEVSIGALGKQTNSCGCLQKESRIKTHIIHGKSNSRLFTIWRNIKARCYNQNEPAYNNYGARGIMMCDEWIHDFQAFYDWSISNGYNDTLTIDRINVNGNYEPNNCRWANAKQQAQNRRTSKIYTINGETHCLKEWCEILNLNYRTIHKRIYNHNWDVEKALFTPLKEYNYNAR